MPADQGPLSAFSQISQILLLMVGEVATELRLTTALAMSGVVAFDVASISKYQSSSWTLHRGCVGFREFGLVLGH